MTADGAEDHMPKTETLNLRVSPEFKRRLIEEAKREKRSITNYLETTLTGFWDSRTFTTLVKEKKDWRQR
jgi:predicted HicB family RNase H-like nuclease